MLNSSQYGRRQFFKTMAASAMASSAVSPPSEAASQPAVPQNLRLDGLPLSFDDLKWSGMCEPPASGFSYNEAQVALRYVNGERRLLMIKWHKKDAAHSTVDSLVELRMAGLTREPSTSSVMTVVREWTNWNWRPSGDLLPALANGWHVGGMWWDDQEHVLWYTLWPYYAPNVAMPFLAAVRLHDNGSVTHYGPWYYVSAGDTSFRKVCWYFVAIPPRLQSLYGGRRVALGANVLGASGGSATNWGPGLTAIRMPALSSSEPVEPGVALMDYSPGAGGLKHPWFHCRREADYRSLNSPSALPPPRDGEGFWQSSADLGFPAAWIDTPRRSGLLMLGQRTSNDTWYGLAAERNTHDASGTFLERVSVEPPDLMAEDQGSTGYHSNGWQSAAWVVRTDHLEQVGRGTRKPSADGMTPQLMGQWHLQWPAVARPSRRPYVSHEGMVVDTVTNELVWVHGRSTLVGHSVLPTVHVLGLPT